LEKNEGLQSSRQKDIVLAIAGTLYLLQFFVLLFLFDVQVNTVVLGIGWILIIPAFLMQLMAVSQVSLQGKSEETIQENDFGLAEAGIYGVVRHPLYVGWTMMAVAMAMISQNLASIVLCVIQVISISVLINEEEMTNAERFGDQYSSYRERVPMVNFVLGCLRQLRAR
jgi:protein-S-isoprenylcysteine O-methyltransferase Ste14